MVVVVVLLLGPASRYPTAVSAGPIVATYSDGNHRLQHLVVDKHSALVYVGGTNRLYQLSPDLERQETVETGPRDDSPECPAVDCLGSITKRPTDNINKALVIDYTDTRLIACGTLYQGNGYFFVHFLCMLEHTKFNESFVPTTGICSVRNLKNISEELMEVREPVVANNATASTVVFIAPGPPNPPVSHVLYVGVTFTGNSPYRSEVPAVSSRSLARHEMFQIAKMEVTTGTRISVNSLSRERYPIHYVYGFSSEGFSYFLTIQMRESNGNSPYISKLVRVCQDDRDYYSYTEVPLECTSENGTRYSLVQAAYVDKPGSDLAVELGIRAQDDVLYAVFAQPDYSEGGELTTRPAHRSALCVYSLKSIRRKFMTNIQKCFSGEGHRGLNFISPSLPCVHTVSHFSFCFLSSQRSENERENLYFHDDLHWSWN